MPNIDSVYKTVLFILNKEQRGYLTPSEFNSIGSQVQREIFETYFEDLNQQVRIQQTEYDYSNRVFNTDEKIAEFKTEKELTYDSGKFNLPDELYRLNTLTYENGKISEATRLTRNEYYNIIKSPLTKPDKNCPAFLYEDNKIIMSPSNIVSNIKAQYVKKPEDVRWGYEVGPNGGYVFTDYPFVEGGFVLGEYTSGLIINNTSANGTVDGQDLAVPPANITTTNPNATLPEITITNDDDEVSVVGIVTSGGGFEVGDTITIDVNFAANNTNPAGGTATGQIVLEVDTGTLMDDGTGGYIDFGLHDSERQELVLRILFYAGVVIRDPQVVQTAMAKINQDEANEKQ